MDYAFDKSKHPLLFDKFIRYIQNILLKCKKNDIEIKEKKFVDDKIGINENKIKNNLDIKKDSDNESIIKNNKTKVKHNGDKLCEKNIDYDNKVKEGLNNNIQIDIKIKKENNNKQKIEGHNAVKNRNNNKNLIETKYLELIYCRERNHLEIKKNLFVILLF